MVGSMDRYFTRARAWPSFNSGTGDSLSCKSPGARRPLGRDCSRSWRLVAGMTVFTFPLISNEVHRQECLCYLEGNILVGDFRPGACLTACIRALRVGAGIEVFAAPGSAAARGTCAGRSALGAAAEHAEIIG